VLVARAVEDLERMAAELRALGREVEVLARDLSDASALADVEARLADPSRPVELLVNNAGFGLREAFTSSAIDDEQRLLDVLVTAPMRLTHAVLPQMLARGRGTVINVASVAAYTPRGTYGAAKAWLLSFSRSLHVELRRRGVTVTAVAPGFVHTQFHSRMKVTKDGIPRVLWLRPDYVVRVTLRAAARRRMVTIPSLRYRLIVAFARIAPARVSAAGTLKPR
jgi:short-subunit dehydrogenase